MGKNSPSIIEKMNQLAPELLDKFKRFTNAKEKLAKMNFILNDKIVNGHIIPIGILKRNYLIKKNKIEESGIGELKEVEYENGPSILPKKIRHSTLMEVQKRVFDMREDPELKNWFEQNFLHKVEVIPSEHSESEDNVQIENNEKMESEQAKPTSNLINGITESNTLNINQPVFKHADISTDHFNEPSIEHKSNIEIDENNEIQIENTSKGFGIPKEKENKKLASKDILNSGEDAPEKVIEHNAEIKDILDKNKYNEDEGTQDEGNNSINPKATSPINNSNCISETDEINLNMFDENSIKFFLPKSKSNSNIKPDIGFRIKYELFLKMNDEEYKNIMALVYADLLDQGRTKDLIEPCLRNIAAHRRVFQHVCNFDMELYLNECEKIDDSMYPNYQDDGLESSSDSLLAPTSLEVRGIQENLLELNKESYDTHSVENIRGIGNDYDNLFFQDSSTPSDVSIAERNKQINFSLDTNINKSKRGIDNLEVRSLEQEWSLPLESPLRPVNYDYDVSTSGLGYMRLIEEEEKLQLRKDGSFNPKSENIKEEIISLPFRKSEISPKVYNEGRYLDPDHFLNIFDDRIRCILKMKSRNSFEDASPYRVFCENGMHKDNIQSPSSNNNEDNPSPYQLVKNKQEIKIEPVDFKTLSEEAQMKAYELLEGIKLFLFRAMDYVNYFGDLFLFQLLSDYIEKSKLEVEFRFLKQKEKYIKCREDLQYHDQRMYGYFLPNNSKNFEHKDDYDFNDESFEMLDPSDPYFELAKEDETLLPRWAKKGSLAHKEFENQKNIDVYGLFGEFPEINVNYMFKIPKEEENYSEYSQLDFDTTSSKKQFISPTFKSPIKTKIIPYLHDMEVKVPEQLPEYYNYGQWNDCFPSFGKLRGLDRDQKEELIKQRMLKQFGSNVFPSSDQSEFNYNMEENAPKDIKFNNLDENVAYYDPLNQTPPPIDDDKEAEFYEPIKGNFEEGITVAKKYEEFINIVDIIITNMRLDAQKTLKEYQTKTPSSQIKKNIDALRKNNMNHESSVPPKASADYVEDDLAKQEIDLSVNSSESKNKVLIQEVGEYSTQSNIQGKVEKSNLKVDAIKLQNNVQSGTSITGNKQGKGNPRYNNNNTNNASNMHITNIKKGIPRFRQESKGSVVSKSRSSISEQRSRLPNKTNADTQTFKQVNKNNLSTKPKVFASGQKSHLFNKTKMDTWTVKQENKSSMLINANPLASNQRSYLSDKAKADVQLSKQVKKNNMTTKVKPLISAQRSHLTSKAKVDVKQGDEDKTAEKNKPISSIFTNKSEIAPKADKVGLKVNSNSKGSKTPVPTFTATSIPKVSKTGPNQRISSKPSSNIKVTSSPNKRHNSTVEIKEEEDKIKENQETRIVKRIKVITSVNKQNEKIITTGKIIKRPPPSQTTTNDKPKFKKELMIQKQIEKIKNNPNRPKPLVRKSKPLQNAKH